MLLEKYLPVFQFSEKHSIKINAVPERIFAIASELDFSKSKLIRILFALRGMPARMMNKKGLLAGGFQELEQRNNEEIAFGIIGQFWKPRGNMQHFKPDEFTSFNATGFLKGAWNFRLVALSPSSTMLETETRVQAIDEYSRKKFSRYWFFIQPFSGIIRMEILKLIKRKAEENS